MGKLRLSSFFRALVVAGVGVSAAIAETMDNHKLAAKNGAFNRASASCSRANIPKRGWDSTGIVNDTMKNGPLSKFALAVNLHDHLGPNSFHFVVEPVPNHGAVVAGMGDAHQK